MVKILEDKTAVKNFSSALKLPKASRDLKSLNLKVCMAEVDFDASLHLVGQKLFIASGLFCKSGSFKSHTRFLAVQVTKVVFQLVSAAFCKCHGQMLKGFKYIYPSQRFYCSRLMCLSFVGVYCVDRPIFIQKSVSVLNFLLFIFFKIRWECQSHVDSLHLHCFLEFPIDLVQGRLGCLLMVVLSNFHKTINRSSTVS